MPAEASPTSNWVDPRQANAKPPFSDQKPLDMPGLTSDMSPRPDHGESNYRGSGKPEGRNALVTGGDSGSGNVSA